MRAETWLDQLAHELAARGVEPADAASALVEVEGHLHEIDGSPLDDFGSPAAYAATVAEALDRSRPQRAVTGPSRIAAHGVAKAFGRRRVLADAGAEVRRGEVVLVMGPNGCGKSTFLRIVAGLLRPDDGTVTVDGTVGYAPQGGGLIEHLRPDEHFRPCAAAAPRGHGHPRRAPPAALRRPPRPGRAVHPRPALRHLVGGHHRLVLRGDRHARRRAAAARSSTGSSTTAWVPADASPPSWGGTPRWAGRPAGVGGTNGLAGRGATARRVASRHGR